MLMEEMNLVEAPASDAVEGFAIGLGIGLTLVALAVAVGLIAC